MRRPSAKMCPGGRGECDFVRSSALFGAVLTEGECNSSVVSVCPRQAVHMINLWGGETFATSNAQAGWAILFLHEHCSCMV
eukprot:1159722-Pelagomonas_calceolata.AAC.7